jgi:hypothetical protein
MNLDLLNETYSMVKSKLYFVDIDHTGLTGGTHRSDRSNQTYQFWVGTHLYLKKRGSFTLSESETFRSRRGCPCHLYARGAGASGLACSPCINWLPWHEVSSASPRHDSSRSWDGWCPSDSHTEDMCLRLNAATGGLLHYLIRLNGAIFHIQQDRDMIFINQV